MRAQPSACAGACRVAAGADAACSHAVLSSSLLYLRVLAQQHQPSEGAADR